MRGQSLSPNWGRLAYEAAGSSLNQDWRFDDLPARSSAEDDSLLPVGNNRSYGDSGVNARQTVLATRRLNRFIAFDRERGTLVCESGVLFEDILRVIVPHGWYLPVVPGTQFVTVGGAIANDIHGKNHVSAGTFGCHVDELTLLRSDGQRLNCSSTTHSEIFCATIGGLGLTGLIVAAKIRLQQIGSGMLESEVVPFSTLEEYVQLARDSSEWPYTVAWVDCAHSKEIGRGLFTRGKFVAARSAADNGDGGKRLSIPFSPPFGLVNGLTVRAFNAVYYAAGRRKPGKHVWHERFFFPLDAVRHWNKIYGPTGFYQYQFVVPFSNAILIVKEVMQRVAGCGSGSFLAVLKDFGPVHSPGLLSFPSEGLTLAVDVPNRGSKTLKLLDELDALVASADGRLYPAKDARMSSSTFQTQYPQWREFEKYRDPAFSSSFWRRVAE